MFMCPDKQQGSMANLPIGSKHGAQCNLNVIKPNLDCSHTTLIDLAPSGILSNKS